jgi:hypothetical protein
MPKIIIFQKITCAKKNASPRAELHLKFSDQLIQALIGGEIFFFSKWAMSGIKMSVFCADFKNVNLPWDKMRLKKVIPEKLFFAQKNGQVP